MTTERIDVTIVLCTYNRADRLRVALLSLTALQIPDGVTAEVLVVDNASTDHTADVVNEVAIGSPIFVRGICEDKQGVVHARNCGVANARGEWIAFFDDDQLADPHWLAELLRAASEQKVRCVGGFVMLQLPDGESRNLSPVCRILLGETVGRKSAQKYDHRFTPGTGNLMVHRTAFEEVGTFNPEFHERGEDTDFFLRMLHAGMSGWFTPAAIVHHVIPPERLSDEFLLRLSHIMANGMAEDERHAHGKYRYPVIWLARVAQLVGVLIPRWMIALVRGDRERRLGARCRLTIAAQTLRDGWRLMTTASTKRSVNPAKATSSSVHSAAAH